MHSSADDTLPHTTAAISAGAGARVIHCDESHAGAWDAFIDGHAHASFYHLFAWRALIARNFSHPTYYLATRDGDALTGVLPLVYLRSRLFGKILCSMPFVNFGGVCAADSSAERALFDEAQTLAHRLQADYVELRATVPPPANWSAATHKVSMTLVLDADAEKIMSGFSAKHRKNVKRAYKNGFETRHGGVELLDAFFDVLSESWRNLGTPLYHKDYFRDVLQTFPRHTRVFVVYSGKVAVAAALVGYYRDTVEGMWAGSRAAFRALQPNYVLYWEMIKHACESGYRHFHLGRSSADSNAETFKLKWNASAQQLYWQYYLPGGGTMPALNVNNPKYRLAIALWQRLPVKLTTLLGPSLAKHIP